MTSHYLEPTQAQGAALFSRPISGPVVMLNLLRFREAADYSNAPELAPKTPVSGREAYEKYMDVTRPFLKESGGEVIFQGDGGPFLIGPEGEQWDMALLIRQNSLQDFLAFASNQAYLKGLAHRTAAVEDSRLLPLVEALGTSGT